MEKKLARQGIESILSPMQAAAMTFAFSSLFILLLWVKHTQGYHHEYSEVQAVGIRFLFLIIPVKLLHIFRKFVCNINTYL